MKKLNNSHHLIRMMMNWMSIKLSKIQKVIVSNDGQKSHKDYLKITLFFGDFLAFRCSLGLFGLL